MNKFIFSKNERVIETFIPQKNPDSNSPHLFPLFLLLMITILAYNMAKKPFIEVDEKGTTKLAEWREEKLAKELDDLEEAEQYVLLARRSGMYPCFSCVGSNVIYLRRNQIYKYGFTTKGKRGRYQNSLEGKNLRYVVEYTGTITECMRQEKIKIYRYALLPENLERKTPLIRPPGNKQDN